MEQSLTGSWPDEPNSSTVEELRLKFERAAHEHQATLLRIATHLCHGDVARAQDLVQDALVNAYQAYLGGSFSGGNLRAWLIRILTNVFLNDHRRRKRWQSDVKIDEDMILRSPLADQPDEQSLSGVYDAPIEEALQELPEPQRMCIYLVDVEEMNYEEAAQSLGVPVGTVRSRLARGRAALFEKLKNYGKKRGYLK